MEIDLFSRRGCNVGLMQTMAESPIGSPHFNEKHPIGGDLKQDYHHVGALAEGGPFNNGKDLKRSFRHKGEHRGSHKE